MEETKKLGQEKITKLLLKYSMPAIVGMVINSIYNVVDRMFIGNSADIGSIGIGGINITAPIYTFMMGVALLFGTGGSILFSIALGQKKQKKAKRALGISTSILAITGIAITVFGLIFLDPLLKLLGAER